MKYVAAFASVLLALTPVVASADQTSDLQAQVQQLYQYAQQLMQQKNAANPAVPSASCPAITTTLGPGSRGLAVAQLQSFLTSIGDYSANITSYYGPITTAAVGKFQIDNNIVAAGTPETNGFGRVGPKTLAAVKAQCAGRNATVGAFMKVSPDQGTVPLYVSIVVTANTTNSCGASNYMLDWGDKSAAISFAVPAGACTSVQQTYTHTYVTPAAYNVKLSSGAYSSEASVVAQPKAATQ